MSPAFLFLIAGIFIAALFFTRLSTWLMLSILLYACELSLPSIPMTTFFYYACSGLLVYSFIRFLLNTERIPKTHFRKYVYGFGIVIVITMFCRGFGLRVLGSAHIGGVVYLHLLIVLGTLLFSSSMRLTEKQWKITFVVMCVMPCVLITPDWFSLVTGNTQFADTGSEIKSSAEQLYLFFYSTEEVNRYSSGVTAGFNLFLLSLILLTFRRRNWLVISSMAILSLALVGISGYRSMAIRITLVGVTLLFLKKKLKIALLMKLIFLTCLFIWLLNVLLPTCPLAIQRTFTWIPFVQVDPLSANAANVTDAWRVELWKRLLPEIPRYFWLGKGCAFGADELAMLQEQPGYVSSDYDAMILTGNYHNGPLDLLIRLGIFGLISCSCLFLAVFYRHYKITQLNWVNGQLQAFHRIFLAFFTAGVLLFLFLFGAINFDLPNLLFLVVILEGLVRSGMNKEVPADRGPGVHETA